MDLIQQSLNGSFGQFIVNCHMNENDSALSKLLNMLVISKEILKTSRSCIFIVKILTSGESLLEQEVYERMSQRRIFLRENVRQKKYFRYSTDDY